MSRIGKLPVTVPPSVKVTIQGNTVTVKGPKGELTEHFSPAMAITLADNTLKVARPSDSPEHRALHGLTRSLLANMVKGVTDGFEQNMEIVGVGYKVEKQGDKILLRVGLSHTVEVVPPPGVSFVTEGAVKIKVLGASKQAVGQTAAHLRAVRPPDAYKGKGIRYAGEVLKLKPGKAGKAIGGKE